MTSLVLSSLQYCSLLHEQTALQYYQRSSEAHAHISESMMQNEAQRQLSRSIAERGHAVLHAMPIKAESNGQVAL